MIDAVSAGVRLMCGRCREGAPWGSLGACPACGGILEPVYAQERLARLAHISPGPGVDRYRDLLPTREPLPFLGEGLTPLLPSRRLGPELGLARLWLKVEGGNPTGSFKDRAAALVAALAREGGRRGILGASSGNASSALAAYSAAAGLGCLILMEPGNPPTKLRQTLATGARVLTAEGLFSRGPQATSELLPRLAAELDYYLGFMWAPVNPLPLEGYKTLAYEVVEQLGEAPGAVITPVGGGDLITGQWRGYRELARMGRIRRPPRMIAVQAEQAAPLYRAFRDGAEQVPTLVAATSVASGINVPFSGDHALHAVRESGGTVGAVSDAGILQAQQQLATREGLWVEPAGAAPAALLSRLLEEDQLEPDEAAVCVLTGAGYKDPRLAREEARQLGRREPLPYDPELLLARARELAG